MVVYCNDPSLLLTVLLLALGFQLLKWKLNPWYIEVHTVLYCNVLYCMYCNVLYCRLQCTPLILRQITSFQDVIDCVSWVHCLKELVQYACCVLTFHHYLVQSEGISPKQTNKKDYTCNLIIHLHVYFVYFMCTVFDSLSVVVYLTLSFALYTVLLWAA